jgi:hypothetical protein
VSGVIGVLYWTCCSECVNVDASPDGEFPNCGMIELLAEGADVHCANYTQHDVPPESADEEEE